MIRIAKAAACPVASDGRPLEKLPKRVRRAIAAVQSGLLLCRTYRVKEDGSGETTFAFEPSGRRCGRVTAEAAIASGYLAPQADGLLGVETAQTFRAAHVQEFD